MEIVKKAGVALLDGSEYEMKVNPDGNHVKIILDKLKANNGYCPCMPMKTKDTICPCKYMRKFKACRCGLYVKEGDKEE